MLPFGYLGTPPEPAHMPKKKLTDRTVAALKPPSGGQVDYFDDNPRCFGVRVNAGGRKSFFVMYRFEGRLRRYTLGPYPALKLGEARKKAKDALHDAAHGKDPAVARAHERKAIRFSALGREYMERHAKVKKRSWQEDERILDVELVPHLGGRTAKNIERRDIQRLIDAIARRPAPVQANRTLALVRKIYNFGIEKDLVSDNPCRGVPRPAAENERERVLTDDEIRRFWRASATEPDDICGAFRLFLLTGQRHTEVLQMEQEELDLGAQVWVLPGRRTKNGLVHSVPLPDLAMTILRGLDVGSDDRRWVFESSRKSGPRRTLQKPLARIRTAAKIDDFRIHDLRRTMASKLTSAGVPRQTVARLLNHAERDVTRVYDRYSYDREKREAMEIWAAELLRLTRRPLSQPSRAA